MPFSTAAAWRNPIGNDSLKAIGHNSQVLLIFGYILGVPPLLVLTRALKNPGGHIGSTSAEWRLVLLAEFIGMVLITAGWLLRRDLQSALIYGAWLILFSWLWLRSERALKR